MDIPILMLVIGVLVLALAVFFVIRIRKHGHKPNFRTFFIIGLTWIPLGIISKNWVFTIVGVVFMILGITNKKRWKEEERWSELSPEAKRIKIILIVILGVLVLAGIATYFITKNAVGRIEL
jgi:hypothetical protein